jgi:hypothetical protein
MSRSIAQDILVQSKPKATSTDQSWMLALSSMLLLVIILMCLIFYMFIEEYTGGAFVPAA